MLFQLRIVLMLPFYLAFSASMNLGETVTNCAPEGELLHGSVLQRPHVPSPICGSAGTSLLPGLFPSCRARASDRSGFSGCGAPGPAGFSTCGSRAQQSQLRTPEHRPSSCGAWAYLPPSVWNLPRSGLSPCLLHWREDSLPLSHEGSPSRSFVCKFSCIRQALICLR